MTSLSSVCSFMTIIKQFFRSTGQRIRRKAILMQALSFWSASYRTESTFSSKYSRSSLALFHVFFGKERVKGKRAAGILRNTKEESFNKNGTDHRSPIRNTCSPTRRQEKTIRKTHPGFILATCFLYGRDQRKSVITKEQSRPEGK